VVDLADCSLATEAAWISGKTGFEIESHLVEFIGRCGDCQQLTLAKGL
jgi:Fe2+ or Zn2+ uptake regulation protein